MSTRNQCRACGERPAAKKRSVCLSCHGKARRGKTKRDTRTSMRVLLFDLETTPNLAYVWGLWDQNVSLGQLQKATEMLCFAAKWLGEAEVMFHSVHDDGRTRMVEAAHALLNEADVVVHYNGKKFDIPHLNREFLLAGLTPPRPYKQVDLLSVVRQRFRFPSNKLQYVAKALHLSGKVEHEGFDLWLKCMAGDSDAWTRMETYNRHDVVLTEEVYEIILPWIPGHPSRRLYDGHGGCPNCVDGTLERDGFTYTALSKFRAWLCLSCGSHLRDSRREAGVSIQGVSV